LDGCEHVLGLVEVRVVDLDDGIRRPLVDERSPRRPEDEELRELLVVLGPPSSCAT
jgi:hypothetical protein